MKAPRVIHPITIKSQACPAMDEDTSRTYNKPSAAKLSRTPSWVLLGFIVGAGFVWLLPEREAAPVATKVAEVAPVAKAQSSPRLPAKRSVTDIEAVFEEYGRYAVWDQNRTEVGMWNAQKNAYGDFYEVIRQEGNLYFRSIPRLTRPMLANAEHSEVPLVFTETEEMRKQWYEARKEMVPGYAAPRPEAPKVEPQVEKPSL